VVLSNHYPEVSRLLNTPYCCLGWQKSWRRVDRITTELTDSFWQKRRKSIVTHFDTVKLSVLRIEIWELTLWLVAGELMVDG
jgi:hypothetical protein